MLVFDVVVVSPSVPSLMDVIVVVLVVVDVQGSFRRESSWSASLSWWWWWLSESEESIFLPGLLLLLSLYLLVVLLSSIVVELGVIPFTSMLLLLESPSPTEWGEDAMDDNVASCVCWLLVVSSRRSM